MNTPARHALVLFAGSAAWLIASLSCPAQSSSAADWFRRGNEAFTEGRFDEAIDCYRSMREREGVSSSLFYNLANAYRENGELGPAILNYERALWMAPGDPDLWARVTSVQKDEGLFDVPESAWTHPFRSFSLTQWTWTASSAWALLGTLSLIAGLGVRRLWCKRITLTLSLVLAVSGCGVAYHLQRIDRAVVLQPDAALRVSPFEGAKQIATLRAGSILHVQEAHGNFVKISAPANLQGWITSEAVERIVPVRE